MSQEAGRVVTVLAHREMQTTATGPVIRGGGCVSITVVNGSGLAVGSHSGSESIVTNYNTTLYSQLRHAIL